MRRSLVSLRFFSSAKQEPRFQVKADVPLPKYLQDNYWWAYLHPNGLHIFEREWLVNLILWGNFSQLRDCALDEFAPASSQKVLQVACVYGNFTQKLAQLLPASTIDVVDVAPIQLENLTKKVSSFQNVRLHHQSSADLKFSKDSFDSVVVFFLLHEMPQDVRSATVKEALRVVKPGGKVVFVDYHKPVASSPFRYIMVPILKTLEPFALDLWHHRLEEWLPKGTRSTKETYFGGLYQKVVCTK